MGALEDKIRGHVKTVHLRPNHWGKEYLYVSAIEGRKVFTGIRTIESSGPEHQQHAEAFVLRAKFQIPQSLTEGVWTPAKLDQIEDTTGPEPVVWTLVNTRGMTCSDGMWVIEFVSGQLTKIGLKQMTGI